jgi:hypothetical protein
MVMIYNSESNELFETEYLESNQGETSKFWFFNSLNSITEADKNGEIRQFYLQKDKQSE